MATITWAAGVSGSWETAANWIPAQLPTAADDVVIDADPVPAGSAYTVTVGAPETVNSLSMNANHDNGVFGPVYSAAILKISSTLTFAPGSTGVPGSGLSIDGSLGTLVELTDGAAIVNAGMVQGFFDAAGTVTFSGTSAGGLYFTDLLHATGTTNVVVSKIGEYDAPNKTMFDGIWDADAKVNGAATINLGGGSGGLVVDVVTLQGPPATVLNGFTQLLFEGVGSQIMEWNGTAYVAVESTLTNIGAGGFVDVTGGRNYSTLNTLTVSSGGHLEMTSGLLSTAGLTINAGGFLTNGETIGGINGQVLDLSDGTLTINGAVVNNGEIDVFGAPMVFNGPVSGTGRIVFKGAGSVEMAGANGQTIALVGGDVLQIDTPAAFTAAISSAGAGNTLLLKNLAADSAAVVGNTLQVSKAGAVVASLALSGNFANAAFTVTQVGTDASIAIGTGVVNPPPPAGYPVGGPGNDTIGGGGSGTIVGGGGTNVLIAQGGPNTVISTGLNDFVVAASGLTTVQASGSGLNLLGGNGSLVASVSGSNAVMAAGDTTADFTVSGDGSLIFGGTGTMNLHAIGAAATIAGGTGQAFITAEQDAVVFGGPGALNFLGNGPATVVSGVNCSENVALANGGLFSANANSLATVTGGAGEVTIFGGAGSLTNFNGAGPGLLVASAGNETLNAAGSSGSNFMVGSLGTADGQMLIGGSGADTMLAAAGTATLSGGAGADAFVFFKAATAGAHDIIRDFDGSDSLYVLGYDPTKDASALVNTATVDASGVTLTLSDNTQITFSNLSDVTPLFGHILYGG